MKLSSVKSAENLRKEKNPAELLGTGQECKDGLLPFVKRNICESVEMQSIMLLDHEGVPSMSLSGALSLNLMFTLDIFVVLFVDGKFIVFVCQHLLVYSLEYIHFPL